jgi:hypothetical protein
MRRSGELGSVREEGQSAVPGISEMIVAQPLLVNSSERWMGVSWSDLPFRRDEERQEPEMEERSKRGKGDS